MGEKAVEISSRNTKAEILKAYNEALKQIHSNQQESPEEKQALKTKEKVVEKASQSSEASLENQVNDLKVNFVKQIDQLKELLVEKSNTFHELQKAVKIQEDYLKELYDIKANAQTLSSLLMACDKERHTFDQEMQEKRNKWKEEQQLFEKERKEEQEELKKKRQREEADYQYELSLKRRKEQEDFENKKNQELEEIKIQKQNLEEREQKVKEQLEEFNRLQEKVAQFPEELKKQSIEVESKVRSELDGFYANKMELKEKEVVGEQKLMAQKIESLEAKIREQEALIKLLNKKADDATEQVQSIACRALEASSERFNSFGLSDKSRSEKSSS